MTGERRPRSLHSFKFRIEIFSDPHLVFREQNQVKDHRSRIVTPQITNYYPIPHDIEPHVAGTVYTTWQRGHRKLIQAVEWRHKMPGCFVVSWTLIGYDTVKLQVFVSL